MAKVNISQLYQGISRSQPAHRRNPGYLEESVNAAHETVKGTSNRNGLTYTGKIEQTLDSDFVTINIKGARVFIDSNNNVIAIDPNGTPIQVEDQTATGFSYLFSSGTIQDLDWVVSLDTAIIVNTTVAVAANTSDDFVTRLEVNTYSELPSSTEYPESPVFNGYYRVLLRENRDPAGYYQYDGTRYNRVSAPNDEEAEWDLTTMPHRFVYDSVTNKVTFSQIPFKPRLSGTSKSNLILPIVGKNILAVDYFQSRLVLLAEDSINLSANSDIYQLFVDDVENIVAQDRISKDILDSNIGTPHGTVSLGSSLIITCENSILSFDAANGTELLTSVNGAIRRIADTKCQDIKVLSNGNRVAIADSNNLIKLIGIVDVATGPQLIGSLNDYDPKLLKNQTIKQIFVDDQELYVLCDDGSLFIHRSEISNGQYVQLAWTEFESNVHTPLFIDSWNNRVRFVCESSSGQIVLDDWIYSTDLEQDSVTPGSSTYSDVNVKLDAKELVQGTYLPQEDVTYFTHSGDTASTTYSMIMDPSRYVWYKPYRVDQTRAYFRGKISGYWYLGFRYEWLIKLTNLWNGPDNTRLVGSKITFFHQDTTNYKLTIGRKNGTQRTHSFNHIQHNGSIIGGTTSRIVQKSGTFTSLLVGDTRNTDITISNDTPGNVTINAIQYTIEGKGR